MTFGEIIRKVGYGLWATFALIIDLLGYSIPYPWDKERSKVRKSIKPSYGTVKIKPEYSTTLTYLEKSKK